MSIPDKSILYIEDHEETRLMIIAALEIDGYRVVTARTASAGLMLAQNSHFDLYLIDYMLPDSSGVDLCRSLRSFDSVTPIMFLTGVSDPEVRRQAFEAGAQGYIVKPANFNEMKAAMAGLIQESRCAHKQVKKHA
jgi:two-component system, OmpR family, manganese sensing response regulator